MMDVSLSGKSVPEFFGPIPIDVDKAGQLARRIKMLKKENRLLPPQQTNQRLKRVAGGSKLEDFKVDELVRICGLSEKSRSKKLEEGQEEPPRGRAKELPEEEKALMVEQNPGNRSLFFSSCFKLKIVFFLYLLLKIHSLYNNRP